MPMVIRSHKLTVEMQNDVPLGATLKPVLSEMPPGLFFCDSLFPCEINLTEMVRQKTQKEKAFIW